MSVGMCCFIFWMVAECFWWLDVNQKCREDRRKEEIERLLNRD